MRKLSAARRPRDSTLCVRSAAAPVRATRKVLTLQRVRSATARMTFAALYMPPSAVTDLNS